MYNIDREGPGLLLQPNRQRKAVYGGSDVQVGATVETTRSMFESDIGAGYDLMRVSSESVLKVRLRIRATCGSRVAINSSSRSTMNEVRSGGLISTNVSSTSRMAAAMSFPIVSLNSLTAPCRACSRHSASRCCSRSMSAKNRSSLIVVVPEGRQIIEASFKNAISDFIEQMRARDDVSMVISPFAAEVEGPVSADGRAAFITIQLASEALDVPAGTRDELTAAGVSLQSRPEPGSEVSIGGDVFNVVLPGLSGVEVIGAFIALAVLLFLFRSFGRVDPPTICGHRDRHLCRGHLHLSRSDACRDGPRGICGPGAMGDPPAAGGGRSLVEPIGCSNGRFPLQLH